MKPIGTKFDKLDSEAWALLAEFVRFEEIREANLNTNIKLSLRDLRYALRMDTLWSYNEVFI
jgi:hypothetical protein